MRIFEFFLHFFTPRHSNNHRARAIHNSVLAIYLGLFLLFQVGITAVTRWQPGILGYASNITVGDLLNITNEKRVAGGVSPVQLDAQLSAAAAAKGADMFANQYWAHTSPSGRDPWSFVTAAGYNYLFAGENLARDFGDSRAVVDAWVSSTTHRENLLNPRYKDIGFAVINGKYGNHETTLVVQVFGTRPGVTPTVVAPEAPQLPSSISEQPTTASPVGQILNLEQPSTLPQSRLDPFTLTRNVSMGLAVFLMGILIVDGILIYRRRVLRLTGHNLAHLLMLLTLLAALNLIGRGIIL